MWSVIGDIRTRDRANERTAIKAWMLDPATKRLELRDEPIPRPRRGAVTMRIKAAMVLGYMKELLAGARGDAFPSRPFVPGTNAVGVIEEVGRGVYDAKPDQRV